MSKKILLSLVNLVIILVSVLGIEPVQAETIFDDVSADHWAYESIMRLYDAGHYWLQFIPLNIVLRNMSPVLR